MCLWRHEFQAGNKLRMGIYKLPVAIELMSKCIIEMEEVDKEDWG